MSLHAQLSSEAQERLHAQQRNSTITSIVISVLVVLLMCIILLYLLLPPIDNFTPEIVSYQTGQDDKEKVTKREMTRAVQRKPSAPSSAMAKVIAANTQSNVAIPVPEEHTPMPSLDFGDGDDFGDGWGDDWGDGSGSGTTFFGTKLTGERILFIIDYSKSMKQGKKDELMRKELAESVGKLPQDKKYQMIFFAGPAWVAGDHVTRGDNKTEAKAAIVTAQGGGKYSWLSKGSFSWWPDGKKQQPKWIEATDKKIKASKEIVKNDQLVGGTVWSNPLEMAFRMDPLPNVIIFMTDGATGGNEMTVAEEYSKLGRSKGVLINTISLMEPEAAEAMEKLAVGTGGTFSLINENGEKTEGKTVTDTKKKKKKKK